jgi:hypothetical protein
MGTLRADEISNIFRERILKYNREVKIRNTGNVLQVGEGIARIYGLNEVMAGELVEFEEGTIGIALNFGSQNVGVVLMGEGLMIREKSSLKATGRIAQILVSEAYLGRVINAWAHYYWPGLYAPSMDLSMRRRLPLLAEIAGSAATILSAISARFLFFRSQLHLRPPRERIFSCHVSRSTDRVVVDEVPQHRRGRGVLWGTTEGEFLISVRHGF